MDIEKDVLHELCTSADRFASKFESYRSHLVKSLHILADDLLSSRPQSDEEKHRISQSFMRWSDMKTVKSVEMLPLLRSVKSSYSVTFSQIDQR